MSGGTCQQLENQLCLDTHIHLTVAPTREHFQTTQPELTKTKNKQENPSSSRSYIKSVKNDDKHTKLEQPETVRKEVLKVQKNSGKKEVSHKNQAPIREIVAEDKPRGAASSGLTQILCRGEILESQEGDTRILRTGDAEASSVVAVPCDPLHSCREYTMLQPLQQHQCKTCLLTKSCLKRPKPGKEVIARHRKIKLDRELTNKQVIHKDNPLDLHLSPTASNLQN